MRSETGREKVSKKGEEFFVTFISEEEGNEENGERRRNWSKGFV